MDFYQEGFLPGGIFTSFFKKEDFYQDYYEYIIVTPNNNFPNCAILYLNVLICYQKFIDDAISEYPVCCLLI